MDFDRGGLKPTRLALLSYSVCLMDRKAPFVNSPFLSRPFRTRWCTVLNQDGIAPWDRFRRSSISMLPFATRQEAGEERRSVSEGVVETRPSNGKFGFTGDARTRWMAFRVCSDDAPSVMVRQSRTCALCCRLDRLTRWSFVPSDVGFLGIFVDG
eukprot:scaffold967_cov321-Pavlova_lutheri.AAC.32